MPRRARVSPDRLLAAAAVEFATHGFAGARVDRIARRARVNKAMLYYHFQSKSALYRTLLRHTFTEAAARLGAVAGSTDPPSRKMDRVAQTLADFLGEHEYFPAVMMREIAEGGARLDPETAATIATLPRLIADIVAQGVADGDFRPVDPLFAYFTLIAPLVFFRASAPIRSRVLHDTGFDGNPPSAAFVIHVQDTIRRLLAHEPSPIPRRP